MALSIANYNQQSAGGTPALPPLTPHASRLALARADLVRSYLQAIVKAGRSQKKKAARRFIKAYNTGLAFPEIFQIIGLTSLGSIERWKKRFRDTSDFCALVDSRGLHRKGSTILNDQQQEILRNLLLFPNALPKSEVIRSARAVLEIKSQPSDFSDATARRWLDRWIEENYDVYVFWREGEQALKARCLPYLDRDWSKLEVGDLLVADGHTLNFEILNPFTGKPARMTLILWLDMRSNYPAGWEIMPTENTAAISIGLRRAILRLGRIPRFVYLDNGKAFRARFFKGCPDFHQAGLTGLYERLGCRTIFAWPYNPQSKPVERFFGSFGALERRTLSYVGSSVEKKPPRLKGGEKLHKRIHQKLTAGACPTIEQVHRAIAAWIDDEYGSRPQKGTHLKGACPLEVFEAGRGSADLAERLDLLMMAEDNKRIGRNGIRLRIDGEPIDFYAPELYGRKHQVTIRYDRADLALGRSDRILVYYEGKKLCEAVRWDPLHPLAEQLGTEAEKEEFKQRLKIKQSLKKETLSPARKFAETEIIPTARLLGDRGSGIGDRADPRSPPPAPRPLTPAEASAIEADAAALEVITEADMIRSAALRMRDTDRYDELLKLEVQDMLNEEDLTFMRNFRETEEYRRRAEYYDEQRTAYTILFTADEKVNSG